MKEIGKRSNLKVNQKLKIMEELRKKLIECGYLQCLNDVLKEVDFKKIGVDAGREILDVLKKLKDNNIS